MNALHISIDILCDYDVALLKTCHIVRLEEQPRLSAVARPSRADEALVLGGARPNAGYDRMEELTPAYVDRGAPLYNIKT